jgi:MFS family permease
MAYHRSDQQIERSLIMAKDRLITPGYCFILAANFLLYFGFWLLIPVLPFYLSEFFQAGNSTIGIVLSCYTVAALCIRPFSGYLLDTFARKPLYLFAYFIFMLMFAGYLIAGSLTLFIIFRIRFPSAGQFRKREWCRQHHSIESDIHRMRAGRNLL